MNSAKVINNKLNITFTSKKACAHSINELDDACRDIAREMAEAVKQ